VVQSKEVCFIFFGYVPESLDMANIRNYDNDSPPNVESVGRVSKDIFLFNLPA
jgi:hypothetical protein